MPTWFTSAVRPHLPPGTTARGWLAAASGYALLQLFAGLASPASGWVTTAGLGAQCLLAAMFAAVRAGRPGRPRRWRTLAAAFACWAATYLMIAGEELVVGPHPATSLVDEVLFVARAVPFLLLFTAGLTFGEPPELRRADLASAAVFVLLASVVMLGDPFTGGHGVSNAAAGIARDVENIVLAGLALATLLVQRRAADRAFFSPIAVLLTTYAATATVLNHVVIDHLAAGPGSAWLVLGALPFVAFHLAVLQRPGIAPPAARGTVARRLAPALLTIATLAMAFVAVHAGSVVGALLGMAALVAFAWRTSLADTHSRRANAALQQEGAALASLALTDPLTGIANRRAFDTALDRYWNEAAARGSSIAVLIVDVDRFKALNDALGHAAGDACLCRLAATLTAAAMPATCARLGGEEFGIVGALAPAAAAVLGEQLRGAVAALCLAHPDPAAACVTVSVGVAAGPAATFGSSGTLLAAADAALYAAKAGGRNRVDVAPALLLAATAPVAATAAYAAELSSRPLGG